MPSGLTSEPVDQRSKDRSAQSGDDEQIVGIDPLQQSAQPVVGQGMYALDEPPENDRSQACTDAHDQGGEQDHGRFGEHALVQPARQALAPAPTL